MLRILGAIRSAMISLRRIEAADLEWIQSQLVHHWASTVIHSRDVAFQADQLPGWIALDEAGTRVGHLTHTPMRAGHECEVITLASCADGKGIGSRLLEHATSQARAAACTRIFLTTTNDNLNALGFYQKRGWRLVAVYAGAVDRARASKPGIPLLGLNAIPLHDDIELELRFADKK